ncbi:MAG: hypothetical protein J6T25_00210 [Bacilli bacterium]|nr:hypothetical protein [Bacilli bacterium]
MITVVIYGLDQFVVGRLSREMTPNLAKLYELSEDDILFVAPENMVFHKGVEQTSWNIIIHVHAPKKVSVLEDQVAKFILESIGDVAINKMLEFYYYSQDNRYSKLNEAYPRFIAADNLVNVADEDYEDMEEGEGEDEIFTGDIFQDFHN